MRKYIPFLNLFFALSLGCFLSLLACPLTPVCAGQQNAAAAPAAWEDGEYTVDVTLTGGSGRASVHSPATLIVANGQALARIEWSSSHYDYMRIGDQKFLPAGGDGNSAFEIPVAAFDQPIAVIADTTAMSVPHEISYTLTFDSASILPADSSRQAGAVPYLRIAAGLIIGLILLVILVTRRPKRITGCLLLFFFLTGCAGEPDNASQSTDISKELSYTGSMELTYADQFTVDYYHDGCCLISISGDGRYLVVPEGRKVPADLAADIVVLAQPLDRIYLAASAVMDMFASIDSLDSIRFSSLNTDGWYIDEAKAAMEQEEILYAGKYSAPDYEQILADHCDLAIENTMIYHTPEVREQLERLGIPVLVDHSSYESQPLGRTEWVKLYGLLTGKEAAAEAAFAAQEEAFTAIHPELAEAKTVAFFYITSNGEANVRKSADYLAKMIEMAGGTYIFRDLGAKDSSASSTVTMQMEEFYASARDADYIIYNSSIDGELSTIEDLLQKSALLRDFRAVRDGHVYCTTKNLYQSSMKLGTITSDIHKMLTGNEEELTYLYPLT